eukprot:NODE_1731_length_2391_cov_9.371908.p1 GENE.NODE_1731_length_2391_cov_9.371908~~NODE_1731_length_2391_cov_9.371908.p1  ORF type:complete len:505 (-),score=150.44 NODE_1731_length_2391_cov_9.371908:372-1886(-)
MHLPDAWGYVVFADAAGCIAGGLPGIAWRDPAQRVRQAATMAYYAAKAFEKQQKRPPTSWSEVVDTQLVDDATLESIDGALRTLPEGNDYVLEVKCGAWGATITSKRLLDVRHLQLVAEHRGMEERANRLTEERDSLTKQRLRNSTTMASNVKELASVKESMEKERLRAASLHEQLEAVQLSNDTASAEERERSASLQTTLATLTEKHATMTALADTKTRDMAALSEKFSLCEASSERRETHMNGKLATAIADGDAKAKELALLNEKLSAATSMADRLSVVEAEAGREAEEKEKAAATMREQISEKEKAAATMREQISEKEKAAATMREQISELTSSRGKEVTELRAVVEQSQRELQEARKAAERDAAELERLRKTVAANKDKVAASEADKASYPNNYEWDISPIDHSLYTASDAVNSPTFGLGSVAGITLRLWPNWDVAGRQCSAKVIAPKGTCMNVNLYLSDVCKSGSLKDDLNDAHFLAFFACPDEGDSFSALWVEIAEEA